MTENRFTRRFGRSEHAAQVPSAVFSGVPTPRAAARTGFGFSTEWLIRQSRLDVFLNILGGSQPSRF